MTAIVDLETLNNIINSNDLILIKKAAFELMQISDYKNAKKCFQTIYIANSKDLESYYNAAACSLDGTHKGSADARDILLEALENNQDLYEKKNDLSIKLIRFAAERCFNVGPKEKAAFLYNKLVLVTNDADDYYNLSESLADVDEFEKSIRALKQAVKLAPEKYQTPINTYNLETGKKFMYETKKKRKKIGKYPLDEIFKGELDILIKEHIACNLVDKNKIIDKETIFFTMGSCFARNIAVSLIKSGFNANHMEISEYINSTYANRALVNYLLGIEQKDEINKRIEQLLPAGFKKNDINVKISQSNIFILTLGVAPAFFDAQTGEFVLPSPNSLNTRVLAEKYTFRTTSVQENIENVKYLIDFIRNISPKINIVITVSPVPLLASFEFESCVQADCLSKSTMRLVAHEIVNNSGYDNITYFPSFEIFRWGGSNYSNFYAADDGAAWHVSEDKVDSTVKAFIEIFSKDKIAF
jgi:tetratricopeptide (TPR) repeat protein